MWTNRLRYSGLGLLLVGLVVGLLVAWRVNHVLFGSIVGSIAFIALSLALLAVARDGWHQTSPDSLSLTRLQAGVRQGCDRDGSRPAPGLFADDSGLRLPADSR